MPKATLPPHVFMVRARGREYFYHQPFRGTARAGKRTALPGLPFHPSGEPNPEWWATYRAATGTKPPEARAGTFAALAAAWQVSPEWRALRPNTQRNYRTALGRILAAWGPLPVRGLEARNVLQLRDALSDTPEAANTVLKALSSVITWSIPRGWRHDNPCEHVRYLPKGEPWAAWSLEAIEAWRTHAVPQMWRAAALLLYTGQRPGDLLSMTWHHVDAGTISVVQEKTGRRVWIPLHRDLRAALEGAPRTSIQLVTGERGRPLTREGFKTLWQRQHECVELVTGACHGLVAHGLRKSAVCFMLEAGCSPAEVASISGQTLEMIEHYARDMNRQRLARSAIEKWENTR